MANSGCSGHVVGTTALPLRADLRAPKSAFAMISSAVPPDPDAQDGGADSPNLVESGCGAVAVGSAYLLPPLSSGGASIAEPLLRFHTPLIEPDVRY